MILAYPVLLVAAGFVARDRSRVVGPRGWSGFTLWIAAGAVFTFSFLTGLSIGLLFLPLAAVMLFAAAWWSPHLAEAAGFVVGLGGLLVVVAAIGHPGAGWAVTGVAAAAVGVAIAAAARRSRGRASA
jgi:hypothetical protein